jgi:hypothetical protein
LPKFIIDDCDDGDDGDDGDEGVMDSVDTKAGTGICKIGDEVYEVNLTEVTVLVDDTASDEAEEVFRSHVTSEYDALSDSENPADEIADIQAWLDGGAGSDEGKAIKASVAKLLKKDEGEAYTQYLSRHIGRNDDAELELMDENVAYVRGDELYCNGLPLEETDVEGIGVDHMSGKRFEVSDDGSVTEIKTAKKKTKKKTKKKGAKKKK